MKGFKIKYGSGGYYYSITIGDVEFDAVGLGYATPEQAEMGAIKFINAQNVAFDKKVKITAARQTTKSPTTPKHPIIWSLI